MKYTIPPQTGLSDEDAEIIGTEIEALAEQNHVVTPAAIVAAARPKSSRLHPYFEWDDKKAAERYRLNQAQFLLRMVHVVVESQPDPVRAFHVVTVAENDRIERGYVPLRTVVAQPVLMDQVLESARQELESWRKRYSQYQQLSSHVAQVTAIIAQMHA